MDNVVDASEFPLPQQAQEAQAKRRIGLGVTGLADALLMTGCGMGQTRRRVKPTAGCTPSHAPHIWRRLRLQGKGRLPAVRCRTVFGV